MRVPALLAVCGLVAAASAQGVEEARRAWKQLQEIEKDPLSPESLEKAKPEDLLEALTRKPGLDDSAKKVRARAEFLDVFERSDWSAFDPKADATLLRDGLWRAAYRGLNRGDGPAAKQAFEAYAKHFDDSSRVHACLLPKAMLLAGDAEQAVHRMEQAVAAEPAGAERGRIWIALGDARLVAGDREGAMKAWDEAGRTPFGQGAEGPVQDVLRQARVRVGYVGRPAPSLAADEAIGGEAPTWEALEGKVAVVQAFSTGCKACRGTMPFLVALRDRHPGEDFVVLGLTVVESEGFLPAQDTPEPFWVGEAVSGIAPKDYRAHLETFRKRIGIDYPWLVQGMMAHIAWNVRDPHPIVVVGRDGRIAFAQVGGGEISSVHAVVAHLLSSK